MGNPYGVEHRRRRAAANAEMEATGPVTCRRCPQLVYPDSRHELNPDGMKFDLGHGIDVVYNGDGTDSAPEHATCSRSAGGRLAQLRRALARAPHTSREW